MNSISAIGGASLLLHERRDQSLGLVLRSRGLGSASRSASSRGRGSTSATPGWSRAPGDFFTARAGAIPVVVTHAEDGETRAFVNVCRHRGSTVVEGAGNRKTLQCPYHAWTYGLDGRLRAAPRADFELDDVGLEPVRLERWGPFLFVNADVDAAPLADTLGDVPAQVAELGLDVDALQLPSPCRVERRGELEGRRGELPRVLPLRRRASGLHGARRRLARRVPARGRAAALDADRPRARRRDAQPVPLRLAEHRDQRLPRRAEPLDRADRARVARSAPTASSTTSSAPASTRRGSPSCSSSTTQVGREDTALVERVQTGVCSGALAEGRLLGEAERLVAHFQGLVREALGG